MNVRARAGIDVYGTTVRYAEVEQQGPRYRLLRLGRLAFDFDAAAVLHAADTADAADHLNVLGNALGEAFADTAATRLHVVIHPPHTYSFFTPLPVDADRDQRKQRLLREAALLMRAGAARPLRLTADPLYTETLDEGPTLEWYHVLALHERMHTRLDRILRPLSPPHFRMTLSMHAVANAIDRLERRSGEAETRTAPYTLAIGWYPTHVEYVVCRRGRWYFSLYTDADDPADCAYFALLLTGRLHLTPEDLGRLYLYGAPLNPDDFASLHDVFGLTPEPFDPMRLVEMDVDTFSPDDDLNAYTPCIGVTV